jgi:GIY-YIG catalytic domain
MIYTIYKFTNKINGKIYIGFTKKNPNKRLIEHKSAVNTGSDYALHGVPREAVLRSAAKRKGKPSWNSGKPYPQISGLKNGGGNFSRGKTWYKDPETGKRIWE